jgi:hypothetical protein
MKIISKFKDYYDYLQGIYGIDEKLILDRTEFYRTPKFPPNGLVNIYICGYEYEGVCLNGQYYWESDIEKIALKSKKRRYWIRGGDEKDYYTVDLKLSNQSLTQVLKKRVNSVVNDKLNYPILINVLGGELGLTYKHRDYHYFEHHQEFSKFPILADYGFQRVLPAEDLWIQLSNWLSRTKDIPNNQTNKEKILSAGFDLKTSFRNVK